MCVTLSSSLSITERSRSIQTANRKLKESSRQRRSLLLASKKYQVSLRKGSDLVFIFVLIVTSVLSLGMIIQSKFLLGSVLPRSIKLHYIEK